MKFFLAAIATCCVLISLAQASTSGKFKLTGYVRAFDDKVVTIESGNQKFQVPRTLYPDKTRTGEFISVPMMEGDFLALKHETTTASVKR